MNGQREFTTARRHPPGRSLTIDRALTIEVPSRWTLVSSGARSRLAGATSFVELADDEVVVTIVTHDYAEDPDRLLAEVAGAHGRDDTARRGVALRLRAGVSGAAAHLLTTRDAYFVAALVIDAAEHGRRRGIGVEIVGDGPHAAVAARLPELQAMVASIGHNTAN